LPSPQVSRNGPIQEQPMLQKNQPAPDFSLPNQDNTLVNLADYQGKMNVVLYFYPKDDTPGCTIEANQFTALVGKFAERDTVVIGVSKDSCTSHQAFIDKYGLKLDLLADTDGELCAAVWQEKDKNGEKKMGIVRSTFLINKQGVLEEALYGVSAEGHAQAMLERVKQL
jgi:peroxiredoxin Q/BCP